MVLTGRGREEGTDVRAAPRKIPRAIQPAAIEEYSMETAVQTAEARAIIAALRRNRYHRLDAARELGIHKSTFFRKIKRLGIELPRLDGRFRKSGKE